MCFVASHVKNDQRAQQLARMLMSVVRQLPHPPPIAISWSAEAEVAAKVRAIIEAAVAAGLSVRSHEQLTRHSQFQHLHHLSRAHAAAAPEWVLFSDDDDVWSEQRTAIYVRECSSAADTPTESIACRRKAMPLPAAASTNPSDAEAVRALVANGTVRLADSALPDGLDDSEHNMNEYFDCAVRFGALSRFFEAMPPYVIEHKL